MDNRQNKERRFWDKFANIYDSFINVVFSIYLFSGSGFIKSPGVGYEQDAS